VKNAIIEIKEFMKMTEIDICPKCKKRDGYTWTWGKNDGNSTGYATCKGCGAKY
jgi:hypothetical protein|tara:strand:- start:257 stop:418 length:162 start_codon:yes stop_codon:yes gene_type:complete